jgi:hypothetical protein
MRKLLPSPKACTTSSSARVWSGSNEEEEIGWDEGKGEEAWGLEKLIWKRGRKAHGGLKTQAVLLLFNLSSAASFKKRKDLITEYFFHSISIQSFVPSKKNKNVTASNKRKQ